MSEQAFESVLERYPVRLSNFEGPLDLLLHLIRKHEIDVHDIPIVLVTQQYLAYLELMKDLDLEIAGEFLVMAATLIHQVAAAAAAPQPTRTAGKDPQRALARGSSAPAQGAAGLLHEKPCAARSGCVQTTTMPVAGVNPSSRSACSACSPRSGVVNGQRSRSCTAGERIPIEVRIKHFSHDFPGVQLRPPVPTSTPSRNDVTFLALLQMIASGSACSRRPFGDIRVYKREARPMPPVRSAMPR
jgi:segregation and condensation protein A